MFRNQPSQNVRIPPWIRIGSKASSRALDTVSKAPWQGLDPRHNLAAHMQGQRALKWPCKGGKLPKCPKCVQNLPIFFRNISLMPHGVLRCPTQMSIQCCFRMPLHPWKTQCSLEADPGWIQGQPLWIRLSDPRQAAPDPGQCHIAAHGSKATRKSSSRSAQSGSA